MKRFSSPDVAGTFKTYPKLVREKLMLLRELIFETAAQTEGVGKLEETLKWGEPAYLTVQSKSGSTIRLGWKKSQPTQYAMYFHCQTTLVETFRTLFPLEFTFGGNRSILFDQDDNVPVEHLRQCIELALTYHRRR